MVWSMTLVASVVAAGPEGLSAGWIDGDRAAGRHRQSSRDAADQRDDRRTGSGGRILRDADGGHRRRTRRRPADLHAAALLLQLVRGLHRESRDVFLGANVRWRPVALPRTGRRRRSGVQHVRRTVHRAHRVAVSREAQRADIRARSRRHRRPACGQRRHRRAAACELEGSKSCLLSRSDGWAGPPAGKEPIWASAATPTSSAAPCGSSSTEWQIWTT